MGINGATTVPDPGEQVRILNMLQMYENGALTVEGQRMGVLPLMCKAVIDVRKYNRKILGKLAAREWRSFEENSYPREDETVLMYLSCSSVILTHFEKSEILTFEEEGVVGWLRIPELELGKQL